MSTRQLPIHVPVTATEDVIRQALKDRDISPHVFDFIKHNLGLAAALAAILAAEPKKAS